MISEFIRCAKQNITSTVLTILLLVCCILFFSYVSYYYDINSGTVQIRENEMFMDHTIFRFGKANPELFYSEINGQKQGWDPLIDGRTDEEIYEYGLKLDKMIKEIRENGFLDYYFTQSSEGIPFSDVNYEIDVLRDYNKLGDHARWPDYYKDKGYILVRIGYADINFIKNSNLILSEGRLFTQSDFDDYKQGDPVPVILGHKFADYYKIGDIITTFSSVSEGQPVYRGDCAPYIVVGILEKDTIVFNSYVSGGTSMLQNLDYFILLPYLIRDISYYPTDEIQKIVGATFHMNFRFWYNTAFYYERSKLEYGRDLLNEILEKYGFDEYYAVQNSDYNVELTEAITRERVTGLSAMTILVSAFTLFAIVITQLNKYNRNLRAYAVYILTGRTVRDIVLMAAVDMSILFAVSLALSHFPLLILLSQDRYSGTRLYRIVGSVYDPGIYGYILLIGLTLVLICAALCYFTVRKTDIATIIKDGE